jgi:N-acetylglucosamine kinase-like BadF-type ATPase
MEKPQSSIINRKSSIPNRKSPPVTRHSSPVTHHFLGVDVGGTKTHALIADENGQALGFGHGGCGSQEMVGYDGLTATLQDVLNQALAMSGLRIEQLSGAGMGIAGYDWPSQKQEHLDAIARLGLGSPLKIVNDTVLGIPAGAEDGWGVSVVAGTGCNSRGLSKDHQREGRVVGGAGHWSGEAAGGFDILYRAMRAVNFEWTKRGPATALTPAFIKYVGAKDLDDFIGGNYVGAYGLSPAMIMLTFEIARAGDEQAIEVMRWAGGELGGMAVGVINQLDLQKETFDVVLIGSIFDGHPAIKESLGETVHAVAPGACIVRLNVPPVVGGVLLGMEAAGVDFRSTRQRLIASTEKILNVEKGWV